MVKLHPLKVYPLPYGVQVFRVTIVEIFIELFCLI